MEDTLRDDREDFLAYLESKVLILVLMEDTLRVYGSMLRHNKLQDVLILVLMEDTLREGCTHS